MFWILKGLYNIIYTIGVYINGEKMLNKSTPDVIYFLMTLPASAYRRMLFKHHHGACISPVQSYKMDLSTSHNWMKCHQPKADLHRCLSIYFYFFTESSRKGCFWYWILRYPSFLFYIKYLKTVLREFFFHSLGILGGKIELQVGFFFE